MTIAVTFLSACSIEDVIIEETAEFRVENLAKKLNADIQVDNSVRKGSAIIISTTEELIAFIDSVRNQHENRNYIEIISPDSRNLRVLGCIDGIYRGIAFDGPTFDLVFDVSVSNGCIGGIYGGLTGITFMVGYTQGATQYGCKSGTVCGTLDYNLFWEGIGTVYRHKVCYKLSLNC